MKMLTARRSSELCVVNVVVRDFRVHAQLAGIS